MEAGERLDEIDVLLSSLTDDIDTLDSISFNQLDDYLRSMKSDVDKIRREFDAYRKEYGV